VIHSRELLEINKPNKGPLSLGLLEIPESLFTEDHFVTLRQKMEISLFGQIYIVTGRPEMDRIYKQGNKDIPRQFK